MPDVEQLIFFHLSSFKVFGLFDQQSQGDKCLARESNGVLAIDSAS